MSAEKSVNREASIVSGACCSSVFSRLESLLRKLNPLGCNLTFSNLPFPLFPYFLIPLYPYTLIPLYPYILIPIRKGAILGERLKLSVKVGEGIESAVVAGLGNIHFLFNKQFTGIPDPDLCQKL